VAVSGWNDTPGGAHYNERQRSESVTHSRSHTRRMENFVTSIAGVRTPGILYGTAWKKSDTESLVHQALRLGFRGIDTACQPKHYDEPGVGAGMAAYLRGDPAREGNPVREGLYLQTKFTPPSGQDPARIPYDPRAPLCDQVRQSFAASLRNLQVEYLDGLILHSPLPNARQTLEVWRAMEALADEGGVRQLGISNCYRPDQLETLYDSARIKPAVVQNRFHADTGYDREIRAFCRQQRLIYQSFWTLTANRQVLAHRTVTGLASERRRTPAQILFRYLTQIEVVPLTGTRTETHMREDLDIFEFELSELECKEIDALFCVA
jgi:diketogulonate reductase-like aldo/keto reductase